jgi:integrase
VKEADGKYWVRMLADMCKNGKPTLFAVPELLTPIVDYYLQVVRPRMLARQPQLMYEDGAAAASSSSLQHSVVPSHDYFFCKTNGTAPRVEFSTCTSLATMQLIGRPVNAHAFRSAVITTFYSANASQADMDTLANIMSHDAATARNHYYRPQHMRAAEETSQRMMKQLLHAPRPVHDQVEQPEAQPAAQCVSSSSTAP